MDQLGNSDSKLSKDTIKDCSHKLTERTENKRILTSKAKNNFQQVALKSFVKRGELKSELSPDVESKDIRNPWCDSSDEDSHERGCSCHSCRKYAEKINLWLSLHLPKKIFLKFLIIHSYLSHN